MAWHTAAKSAIEELQSLGIINAANYATLPLAYAALVAQGGGVLHLPPGTYDSTEVGAGINVTTAVPTLIQGYGATLVPGAGVTAIKLDVGRSNVPLAVVQGVSILGTAGSVTGIKIEDQYAATLRDVQIRSCATGILLADQTGFSESHDFDNIYISDTMVGIDFQTTAGTGSFGYASWGLVHVDNVPEGGIGVRWGAGTDFDHSHVSMLIVHTVAATATALSLGGDFSRNANIHMGLEGSAGTVTNRIAIDIASTADLDGSRLEIYFAGTWTTLINNPSSIPFALAYQADRQNSGDSASRQLWQAQVFGDTTNRFYIRADGQLQWGPGGVTQTDTSIFRVGAAHLRTEGQFSSRNTSGTSAAFSALTLGLSNPRWRALANGENQWSDGTNAVDTYLRRASAGVLETDGTIKAGGFTLGAAPYSLAQPAYLTRVSETGTWTDEASAQVPYSARINNGAGVQNDAVEWDIVLAAGTYTMDFYHRTGTGNGIYTVRLDGVDLTTVDGYEAAAANRKTKKTGLVIATAGRKRLSLVMATKNASSTGYAAILGGFGFVRTGS